MTGIQPIRACRNLDDLRPLPSTPSDALIIRLFSGAFPSLLSQRKCCCADIQREIRDVLYVHIQRSEIIKIIWNIVRKSGDSQCVFIFCANLQKHHRIQTLLDRVDCRYPQSRGHRQYYRTRPVFDVRFRVEAFVVSACPVVHKESVLGLQLEWEE